MTDLSQTQPLTKEQERAARAKRDFDAYLRDHARERARERIVCGCGKNIARGSKYTHNGTKKHKEWLAVVEAERDRLHQMTICRRCHWSGTTQAHRDACDEKHRALLQQSGYINIRNLI